MVCVSTKKRQLLVYRLEGEPRRGADVWQGCRLAYFTEFMIPGLISCHPSLLPHLTRFLSISPSLVHYPPAFPQETVQALAFAGDSLCVGLSKAYSLIHLQTVPLLPAAAFTPPTRVT
jgi:hypothetical protein